MRIALLQFLVNEDANSDIEETQGRKEDIGKRVIHVKYIAIELHLDGKMKQVELQTYKYGHLGIRRLLAFSGHGKNQ